MRKDTASVARAKSGKVQPILKLQRFWESTSFDNYRQPNSVYIFRSCCNEDEKDGKKKIRPGIVDGNVRFLSQVTHMNGKSIKSD